MRKLVWFAVGFTAACFLGAYFLSGFWPLLLAGFSLSAAIPIFFLRSKAAKAVALILLGGTIGLSWFWIYDTVYLSAARHCDGRYISTDVEIIDYSYENDIGIGADGIVRLDGKPFLIRIYITEDISLKPGDTVTGTMLIRLTTGDGRQEATYHRGSGIFLLGYVKAYDAVLCDHEPAKFFAQKLRANILTLIQEIFPADTLGFAQALLLGDSYQLTYKQDTDLQLSGIRHVIAVSGLHVSILLSMVYLVSGRRRYLTALIGIPVLLLFAALAGFTPSVIRACVMQTLVILALLLNREYDPPTAMAASVVLMLLVGPMTVTSISFQLSAGCMVGIFLISSRIQSFLLRGKRKKWAEGKEIPAKLVRWCVSSVSVTLSAMVTTTPLCAVHFGAVSLVGVFTNLLTLWVISFVFYGIMLSCALGALWLPAGKLVAWLISWPIRYVLLVAKLLGTIPVASVYTCSVYILLWLILCYVLLTAFMLLKRKHPIVFTSCVLVGLVVALAASWLEPRLDPYRFTVYDVGQGQCILFQSNGKNYLVDCGGENDTAIADRISQQLLSQGITELDGAIVTHYDRDHVGAMEKLLSRIEAKKLYLPDIVGKGDFRESLEGAFPEQTVLVGQDMTLEEDGFTVKLFATKQDTGDNESSMCILFQRENCDILITGDRGKDGERELLSHGALPELELLVVGHHGSATSTGAQLLTATRPKQAVISVGRNNIYNHPSPSVCESLKRFCGKVWRTDLHGSVVFRG